MNKSDKFLGQIHELSREQQSETIMKRAEYSLLDYIAVTCAGATFHKDKLRILLSEMMAEKDGCHVIGLNEKVNLANAVFINGLNSHALDYDDGTNRGIIHLGSPIFSLLIPLVKRADVNLKNLLKSAIIGYETSYTLAISIQPDHKIAGYHATGTCGTIGATVAASYMLEFTEEERHNAFSAACVAASGMLKALDDESELKPYNVAKASLLALTSLEMGKAGFKGSTDPLGGRGFLKMMTGREDAELQPVLPSGKYAIEKTYTKPYASCRYTHPAVEAAIKMNNYVKIEDIKEVEIKTYDLAVDGHNHTDISGPYSAKMSIPYATAAGLIFGKAGLQEFSEESIKRPDVLELTRKMIVVADESLSKSFPDKQIAIVTIKTDRGEYSERIDFPKGEPENPLSEKEFRDRYNELMNYAGIDSDKSKKVYELVMNGNAMAEDVVKYL